MNPKLKNLFEYAIKKQDEELFNQAVEIAKALGVDIQEYQDRFNPYRRSKEGRNHESEIKKIV